ncbi:zinc ribbon domain-containing protein [Halorubrum sp. BOL3-1]|uniref:DUF7577 domain-containing protein n=1 Tax=Halorubrum sp. BOL3-1 TaxID=2497325 RepID=UPI0010050B5F|nr:zinc ribbon domain-containing protein [Halorubrum sp. BOL3-1]QAU12940.1 zinc ribbon domain-containing protein [Halorubrum sp. BOL3-1]
MTGDQLLPLAAVLVGVAAVNLAVMWLLVRRNPDPAGPLGSVATRSSDADRDGPDGSDGATGLVEVSGGDGAGAGGHGDPPPLDADGETVVCRHCGAENRAGYRYCRWCVRSGFVDGDTGVTAGTAMTDRSP